MKNRAFASFGLASFPLALGLAGCSAIPVHMNVTTDVNGKHTETSFDGSLDQLPGQLNGVGDQLASATTDMATQLTKVPPPGHIAFKDLDPSFAAHAGDAKFDFIGQAKDNQGTPISFEYVQLGVSSYDDFFKTAQRIYALVYQTDQTIHRMTALAKTMLNGALDPTAQLKVEVDRALAVPDADADLRTELSTMRDLAKTLSVLGPDIVKNVGTLVAQGKALIVGAPASLTNPGVVTHLDLVKKGLDDSVKVIKDSGDLLVQTTKELTGFS